MCQKKSNNEFAEHPQTEFTCIFLKSFPQRNLCISPIQEVFSFHHKASGSSSHQNSKIIQAVLRHCKYHF